MPSDLTVYLPDGRAVRTTRRAYEQIHKAKGWRLTPPRKVSPLDGGDQTADEADTQQEG